jgi:cytochrome c peroxidase
MLGRMIFFDANLSEPRGQSCAACHSEETGFTGPTASVNAGGAVYAGAASTPAKPAFGNRKPTTAAYATLVPPLRYEVGEDGEGAFVGGNFWDGRATGWRLGDAAAEQALGPFLNPVEQHLPDAAEVVRRICAAHYGHVFRRTFGDAACSPRDEREVLAAYDEVGRAISAFEDSRFVNRFSSRYDRHLRGEAVLTARERAGLALFEGKGKCAQCHPVTRGADGAPPVFTDHTYDNLGLPRNPQNPFYASPDNPQGRAWVDPGLGGFLETLEADPDPARDFRALAAANRGKHRVPTLRNVDKRPSATFVKAYGHNGVFKSLKELVHFYNTRDVLPRCERVAKPAAGVNCWPAPEVEENLNRDELGDLKLTAAEEDAIVAFLATLSDE